MPMTYGIIRAVTDGQELTDIQESYKDFYIYDIVHDGGIERPSEVSKEVFLNGPYMYRITVDKTGYYLLRANVVDENIVYNEETGETRELKGYFILRDNRGRRINTYYFKKFRETIACKNGESYNGIYIGYGPEDIKRPIRYSTLMYLEKNKVYTGNLCLSSSKRTDKCCILRLSPNKDIYQYDSKNFKAKTMNEYGELEKSLIEKELNFVIGEGFITKEMNRLEREKINQVYETTSLAKDGICSVMMWVIEPGKISPPEITRTLTTISYRQYQIKLFIDQFMAGWMYGVFNLICQEIVKLTEKQQKDEAIWNGIKETILSTIMSSQAGALAAGFAGMILGGIGGAIISIGFLFSNSAEETRIYIQRLVDTLSEYIDSDLRAKMPLEIEGIIIPMKRFGLERVEYEFLVHYWNGAVYQALGEDSCCGTFQYNRYETNELNELSELLKNAFKEVTLEASTS